MDVTRLDVLSQFAPTHCVLLATRLATRTQYATRGATPKHTPHRGETYGYPSIFASQNLSYNGLCTNTVSVNSLGSQLKQASNGADAECGWVGPVSPRSRSSLTPPPRILRRSPDFCASESRPRPLASTPAVRPSVRLATTSSATCMFLRRCDGTAAAPRGRDTLERS